MQDSRVVFILFCFNVASTAAVLSTVKSFLIYRETKVYAKHSCYLVNRALDCIFCQE